MVSEIRKEKWSWVEECFMEKMGHVLGQGAVYKIGGNGDVPWFGPNYEAKNKNATYGKAKEKKSM